MIVDRDLCQRLLARVKKYFCYRCPLCGHTATFEKPGRYRCPNCVAIMVRE